MVEREPKNMMTSYNIAITVGPNVFRPRYIAAEDLSDVGHYYDILINMMKHYKRFFKGIDDEGDLRHGKLGQLE